MPEACFRFYAELNDFLPPERRFTEFACSFLTSGSVKDAVESFGVPHTEVDLILANGEPVDCARRIQDGDRISVYPVFESFDIAPVARLRTQPLRDPKFILDIHLGRLAAYVRMLGFDVSYRNCAGDEELARESAAEHRILLTRDIGLLKRSAVTHGYFVRETDSRRQLAEVVRRFDLARLARPFTRCTRCNGLLEAAAAEDVRAQVPPLAAELHREFVRCPGCRRVYWEGSHHRRMRALVDSVLA